MKIRRTDKCNAGRREGGGGVLLRWTSIPFRKNRKIPSGMILQKQGFSSRPMGPTRFVSRRYLILLVIIEELLHNAGNYKKDVSRDRTGGGDGGGGQSPPSPTFLE